MQILSNLSLYGTLGLNSVADANTDTDKFLVIDSSGIVKYRTGAELYNDIGAGGAASYTSTLQHEVKAGVALTKGQAVYVTSADGTNMVVSKASNASEATSSKTLGLIAQNLSVNGKGFVITEGLLAGLNTSTANAGDPVWLGTDGNLIYGLGAKPYAPDHLVFIGIVTRVQQNNGEIFVKVQNGFELQELHNVQITSTPSDNAVLAYETSTSLYKMKSIPTLLGYTPVTNARSITINGTTYDLSADRSWSVGTHTGNLTTGYVPKATGATTLTDSLIYDNGSAIGINTASPYESSAFKLDVNGGVIIKNTSGTAAQLILINSNPATGGNNGFVQLSAGGNTSTAFGQWQTYYGMSVASGALRLQPAGGQVLIGTTTTSAFLTDINGTLRVSGQLTLGSTISSNTYVYTMPGASGTIALLSDIPSSSSYVPSSRTLTINGTSYDLSANRSWTIAAGVSAVQAGSGISVSTSSGVVTVVNTGLLSGTAGSGISVSTSGQNLNIVNTGLLSGTAGSGISVSTSGQNLNIVNTGLLSATAGSGISVSTTSQNVNIVNTGLLSATAGTGISVSTTSGTLNIVNTITNTNQLTNGAGYITGITSGMVTTALGYTPYNATNPNGYITGYTETDTLASVTGRGNTTSTALALNGKVTFSSAVANRPQFPGGILGLDTSDGNFDIWGISRDYYPSHATAANAWGLRWNGDNNDFEFVGGGTNRVILDMDSGNITATGTLSASGYNKTNWDTAYGWGNHSGLYLPLSGGTLSGNLYITNSSTVGAIFISGAQSGARQYMIQNGITGISNSGLQIRDVTGNASLVYFDTGYNASFGAGIWATSGNFSAAISASNISSGINASHIVQRDANGYIYANHINFNTSESENPTISSFITSNGDGWSRKSSLQHVRNQLGNYGGWITGYTETDTLASVTSRGSTTSSTLTSTNGLGLYVNSGAASYIGINSTSNWSYVSHLNNGSTTWDVGAYNGGQYEIRPYGGSNNRVTVQLNGQFSVNNSQNQVALFQSGNVNTWVDIVSSAGTWSMGATASNTWAIYNRTGTGAIRFEVSTSSVSTTGGMYAAAYRGNANVAGTGEAIYAPSGVYSTGTNWLYGTMYLNGNTVYDADSIQLNGRYSMWGRWNTYSGYILKIAYMTFDYNSNNGHETYHSIASTDINGSYSDNVSLNSYNDITFRLDANNNNNNSYLRISNNSGGDGTIAWIGYESGLNQNYFSGSMGISNSPRTDGYKLNMGGSIHLNGNSVDYLGSLYFNNAGHIQPNSGSYGSLQFTSTKNGWAGLYFSDTGATLMMNSTESGHYQNGVGWKWRWQEGTLYVHRGSTGGGTSYTVLDSGNYTGTLDGRYFFDYGFTEGYPGTNANSMPSNRSAFTYSNGAPLTGCVAHFGAAGYGIQLNGDYGGDSFSMRSRNGDAGTWRPWKRLLTDYNYNAYALPLSGGTLSGTLTVSSASIGMDWWRDGGGTYMEFYGTSAATRKLRLQGSNGSGSYAQWYIDAGNQQIYGDVAGVRNFVMDSTTAYIRHNGADKLWGGSDGTRNSGWAYHNNNDTGLHWPNNGWHFYPKDVNDMYMRSGSSSNVAIAMSTGGTTRGYVYAENDNTIGFLTNSRNWAFRTYSNGNAQVYGYLTVNGAGTSSSIYMNDSDEGQREIHCNSNRIGFLTQSGNWGAWCNDNGSWESVSAVTTNDWFYVNGAQGIYWSSYGGGWRMQNSSYIEMYGSKSLNMNAGSVDYVGSIYMNGGVYIQTNNSRNLQVTSNGAGDNGIYGRGNSGQFCYQLYGDGSNSYGFLNGVWAGWDFRKAIGGALYMNSNNDYYLATNGTSKLNTLNIDSGIYFQRGGSDYSTFIRAQNHPDAGYSSSDAKYWVELGSYGGVHVTLNMDGSAGSGENGYDHFTIWQAAANSSSGSRQFYVTNIGNVWARNDITAFSDIRVKENIRPIENALQKVVNSRGVMYDRIDTGEKNGIGFIAQELETQIPDLVKTDDKGFKSVKYQNMVAVLTEAIKEQQKQIEELKSKLDAVTK